MTEPMPEQGAWPGEYRSYTPPAGFLIRYALVTPVLQLSTAGRRLATPVLVLAAGAAWYTIALASARSPAWWAGLAVAVGFVVVLLLVMGLREYRRQLRTATFPVGEPVDCYVDDVAIWVRRSGRVNRFSRDEVVGVRRGLGFAVIVTRGRGSFVLPGILLPRHEQRMPWPPGGAGAEAE